MLARHFDASLEVAIHNSLALLGGRELWVEGQRCVELLDCTQMQQLVIVLLSLTEQCLPPDVVNNLEP